MSANDGMSFPGTATPIDLDDWPRREHFRHYLERVPCSYAMTVELEAGDFAEALAVSPRRTYLAQLWAISTVVNRHEEFRLRLDASGRPEAWDVIHPAFTVFNAEHETFSAVWAPYDEDFDVFHGAAAAALEIGRRATGFFPQGAPPENSFDVSSIPWTSFTGFSLQLRDDWKHLAPIFTIGRYVEREGRLLMPLALQVHHAAIDGFHASRLVNELQQLLLDPGWAQG